MWSRSPAGEDLRPSSNSDASTSDPTTPSAPEPRLALVADDDPDVRELVTFKLEQAGFRVLAVNDGVHALEAIAAEPPAVALIDVMMPGLSGIDVVRELRRDPATRSLPVILLTAKAQEHDIEAGFATGADDYIAKPFSPRELLSRVTALMARAGA
jgi:DNA-binding response OmpR family regulator